jgi:hypothetical protein
MTRPLKPPTNIRDIAPHSCASCRYLVGSEVEDSWICLREGRPDDEDAIREIAFEDLEEAGGTICNGWRSY